MKSVEIERDYYSEDESTLQLHSINVFAARAETDFPTIRPMLTEINMGLAGPMEFEIDTAASYSISG